MYFNLFIRTNSGLSPGQCLIILFVFVTLCLVFKFIHLWEARGWILWVQYMGSSISEKRRLTSLTFSVIRLSSNFFSNWTKSMVLMLPRIKWGKENHTQVNLIAVADTILAWSVIDTKSWFICVATSLAQVMNGDECKPDVPILSPL